jgi:hypothetical protein
MDVVCVQITSGQRVRQTVLSRHGLAADPPIHTPLCTTTRVLPGFKGGEKSLDNVFTLWPSKPIASRLTDRAAATHPAELVDWVPPELVAILY